MVMEAALAPLEDDALTLQEALAFIDACEGDAPISPTPPPPRCPSRSDATASASAESDDGLAQLRDERRRRKTLNALAVRRCQRRKKQELQELRVQAAALERRLAGLRAAGARGLGTSGHDQQSLWAFMAEREAAERESSEARNRQLRAALNRYFRLAGALQSLVGADAVDPELQAVLQARPSPLYAPPPRVFSMDYALADLELSMKKLYLDAETVLDSIKVEKDDLDPGQVSVGSVPGQGDYIELKRAHEIPVSRKAAAAAIWKGMSTYDGHGEEYRIKARSTEEESGHKKYEVDLKDMTQRVLLDGVSFMRRFDEDHRTLFAYMTLVTIPGLPGIRFREKSWMQISGNASDRSVLRTCYHMYAESPALAKPEVFDSPSERELRQVQTFVLQAIATRASHDGVRFQQAICALSAQAPEAF